MINRYGVSGARPRKAAQIHVELVNRSRRCRNHRREQDSLSR